MDGNKLTIGGNPTINDTTFEYEHGKVTVSKKGTLQNTTSIDLSEGDKIEIKNGGEYSGEKNNNNYVPSEGISEILIGDKKSSDFSSTDIFGICAFLNKTFLRL